MTAFDVTDVPVPSGVATELLSGLSGRFEVVITFSGTLFLGNSNAITDNTGTGETVRVSGSPPTVLRALLDTADALYAYQSSGATIPVSVMVSPL